jgi:hypothetical protein
MPFMPPREDLVDRCGRPAAQAGAEGAQPGDGVRNGGILRDRDQAHDRPMIAPDNDILAALGAGQQLRQSLLRLPT